MTSFRQAICRILHFSFFLFLVAGVAFGQVTYTAQLRGVVTDQSGAVVPNVTVTLTDEATGLTTTARTGSDGL